MEPSTTDRNNIRACHVIIDDLQPCMNQMKDELYFGENCRNGEIKHSK